MTVVAEQHEQTRARYPDEEGCVERDGVRVFWEVYGTREPTILLLPTWALIHSRHWKLQIPWLARHCRVVTFDGRGNGRSDRPQGAEAYAIREFAADTLDSGVCHMVHFRDPDGNVLMLHHRYAPKDAAPSGVDDQQTVEAVREAAKSA